MMIKKIILLPLICSFALSAQVNKESSFITFHSKVVKADVEQGYLVLERPDVPSNKLIANEREKWWEIQLNKRQPICFDDKTWIFSYEMIGLDDSFYNENSQAENLSNITSNSYNRKDFAINITVEEDNLDYRGPSYYSDICAANNAQVFIGRPSKHGVITYVGDVNIHPPF